MRDGTHGHSSRQSATVVVAVVEHDSRSDDVNGNSALGFLEKVVASFPFFFFFQDSKD